MSTPLLPSLRRAYLRLAQSWPADPLRPELPFSDVIRARSEAQFTGILAPDAKASEGGVKEGTGHGIGVEGKGKISETEQKDMVRQLFALRTLLEGRYELKYPVSQKLTRPRSQPEYYDRLLAEIENAPKRSWWGRKIESWRGWVRWN